MLVSVKEKLELLESEKARAKGHIDALLKEIKDDAVFGSQKDKFPEDAIKLMIASRGQILSLAIRVHSLLEETRLNIILQDILAILPVPVGDSEIEPAKPEPVKKARAK